VHARIYDFVIPEPLQNQREAIFEDLREAFLAFRDGGVFDTSTEFSQQLDIEV
jgi:hypothetical protein